MFLLKILILFLSLSYQLNIGYIIRSNSGTDKEDIKIMSKYFNNTNEGNDKDITIYECIYTDDNEQLKGINNCLKEFLELNIKLIYSYCSEYTMETDDFLMENQILIWCTNTYSVGSCEHNFIMGNSLLGIINDCIFYFIFSGFGNVLSN